MRLKLVLKSLEEGIILPVHYNYTLQGFLYSIMPSELSKLLHDEGFKSVSEREYKLFVYSRIFSDEKPRYEKDNKLLYFSGNINIYFSSPFYDMMSLFSNELSKKIGKSFDLLDNRVLLDSFTIENNDVLINEMLVRTLSPITIYSTLHDRRDKKKTYYYNPNETDFNYYINENMRRKYDAFSHSIMADDESEYKDILIQPKYFDTKRNMHIIYYKDTVIKAYSGIFKLKGSKRILDFCLKTGIGSKNSMGFGMLEEYIEKNRITKSD